MTYKANNEIIYKDDFNQSTRIAPGRVLTDQEVKALEKEIPSLLKSKAIINVEQAEAKAAEKAEKKAKAKPEVKPADKK